MRNPHVARKILITRLRYMGDVVLTTPCVRALKSSFPDARIDYLTQSPYEQLLLNHPLLDTVIGADFPALGNVGSARLMLRLARARYDLVVDLLSNPRSALLAASTLAPRRVGTYHLSRSWAYNVNVRVGKHIRSAVEHHLEHLRRIGINARVTRPELFVTAGEIQHGERILKNAGVSAPSNTVLLQPGAKWQAKRWPAGRYWELAKRASARSLQVAFLAGPGEESYVRSCVAAGTSGFPVLHGLELRELLCVLSAARAYVGNDGGPAHVSAALGKATLVLFGPSEPDIWFAYGDGVRSVCLYEEVACRPCHLHSCAHVKCLEAIGVDRALDALEAVISGRCRGGG